MKLLLAHFFFFLNQGSGRSLKIKYTVFVSILIQLLLNDTVYISSYNSLKNGLLNLNTMECENVILFLGLYSKLALTYIIIAEYLMSK